MALCEEVDRPVTCVSCVVDVPGSNPGRHPPSLFHSSDHSVNILEYPGGTNKKAVRFPVYSNSVIDCEKGRSLLKKKRISSVP
jgi:hypothetical protein